jgi:hypothetical protein
MSNRYLHMLNNLSFPFVGNLSSDRFWTSQNDNFGTNTAIITASISLPVIARSLRPWQSHARKRQIASLSLAMTVLTAGFVYIVVHYSSLVTRY